MSFEPYRDNDPDAVRRETLRAQMEREAGEGWGYLPLALAAAFIVVLGFLVFGAPSATDTTRESNVRTEAPAPATPKPNPAVTPPKAPN